MRAAILALVLVGCEDPADTTTGPTGTPETLAPIPDPDVNTYVPDSFPPSDPQRLVFFGDSITEGYGIDNRDATYTSLLQQNQDRKWPDHVGDDLKARYPALTEVLDVSRGGATTDTVLSDQLPNIANVWGDVVQGQVLVVGTIGGNDMTNLVFTGGDVEAGTAALLANLEQITAFFDDPVRFPDGAYVAITNVYEPSDGVGQVDECFFGLDLSSLIPAFTELEESSRAQAERDGWAWIDLRGHFLGHGFHYDDQGEWYDEEDPTLWLQPDCIHPNERGHHEVRRLFLAAIDDQPLTWVPDPE